MFNMKKKYHDELTEIVRSGIEQRAIWLYEFLKQAKEMGLDYEEYGRKVMLECGCKKAKTQFKPTESIEEFAKDYISESGQKAFDGKLTKCDETGLVIESTYCPLLAAWEKLTDDKEFIKELCDIAMDGDRGILSCYDKFDFEVKNAIPFGDEYCSVAVTKKEE